MSKTFKIVGDDISDGYHTFSELYDHRCLLFINLVLLDRENSTFKRDHYDGWDCIYWKSPFGQVSYHVPSSLRELYFEKIKEENTEYDGHTSSEVINRLNSTARHR